MTPEEAFDLLSELLSPVYYRYDGSPHLSYPKKSMLGPAIYLANEFLHHKHSLVTLNRVRAGGAVKASRPKETGFLELPSCKDTT